MRDYLLKMSTASKYQCWSEVRKICSEHGWHYPAYSHFIKYFWKLKKLGLVEEDHREPIEHFKGHDSPGHPGFGGTVQSSPIWKEQVFYRIVKGMSGDEAWNNPQAALYPQ